LNSALQDLVVVTGASKGIGLAFAQVFAAAGAKVALVARSRANLDAALAAMPAARHAPVAIVADLAGAADAARMVEEAVAALGEIDVLVNLAGAARRTAPDDLNASNWIPKYLTVLSINVACAKSEFRNPGHRELRTRSRR
jgi:NAD(P)-dependent dehydrogenase (short-subunit alcohol dehydrogenase family)